MNKRRKFPEEKPPIDETGFISGWTPRYYEVEEQAIIARLIQGGEDVDLIYEKCSERWFYLERNRIIFSACLELFQSGSTVDLLTVKNKLMAKSELDKIGGVMVLVEISQMFIGWAPLLYSIRMVHEAYIIREILRIGNDIKHKGFNPGTDPFELLDFVQAETIQLMESLYKKPSVSFARITYDNIDKLAQRMSLKTTVTGIPTGFWVMDELASGWQIPDLIIVGGRPGMGKTALALYHAINAAKHKVPTAIFSLEMDAPSLAFRIQSMESDIPGEKIRSGRLTEDEFDRFRQSALSIKDLPLYIDDTGNISILELRAKVRRLKHEHGIKFVIIDYLQLMNAGENFYGSREQEISTISRQLKVMAKENEVAVMALSQLSRQVENRGKSGNVPMLSDLRESGAIEQDADLVIFPHRPEYYKEEVMSDSQTPSTDMAEIYISKQRNGRTGVVLVRYEKAYTRFGPYSPGAVNPNLQRDNFPKLQPSSRLSTDDNTIPF